MVQINSLIRQFDLALISKFKEFKHPKALPTLMIACSGGVDSVVLVKLLVLFYEKRKQRSKITIAYVNHNQRSADAIQQDQTILKKLGHQLKVKPLFIASSLAPMASEASMRQIRYRLLATYAQQQNAFIVTAHHRNDQLETWLLRILRGTSPSSLKGVHARIKKNGVTVIRPLLEFNKSDLYKLAQHSNLPWHEDTSNQLNHYQRNLLRNEVMPKLEKINANAIDHLSDFLATVIKQQKKINPQKVKKLYQMLTQGQKITVDAQLKFINLKAALEQALQQSLQKTTKAHWISLAKQLRQRQKNSSFSGPTKTVEFPGSATLTFQKNYIVWQNKKS